MMEEMAQHADESSDFSIVSDFLQVAKFLKIKRISDDNTNENGKKYLKIEWEDLWAEQNEVQQICSSMVDKYLENPKPRMDILAHTENKEDNSQIIVLRVPSSAVKHSPDHNSNQQLSIHGYQGAALIERLNESHVRNMKQSKEVKSKETDAKLITYSQLEKVGFLDDDNDAETTSPHSSAASEHQDETGSHFTINSNDALSSIGKDTFPTQDLDSNEIGNSMRFLNCELDDAGAARTTNNIRRNYAPRRRQPFQLFKCELCGCEFVHRTHLKIHQRTHTGEKPYKCQFCGRGFAQKGNLHVHQKIHTGEKDFICEICNRAFITNAQLYVHMRTHTNPNKKRPHMTGRPFKSMNPTVKKELEVEANASAVESMDRILVQLVRPEKGGSNSQAPSLQSPQLLLHPPHHHQNTPLTSLTTSPTNDICDVNRENNYIGTLQSIISQNLSQETHHVIDKNKLVVATLQNMPVSQSGDPMYTMQSVTTQSGMVNSSGETMVQILVGQQ